MNNKLKIWETALLAAMCVTLCTAVWAQARQNSISKSLIRLHVIAVSDDDGEQAIKLKVRDAVLEYISPKLEESVSVLESERIINSEIYGIKQAAEAAAQGREVKVTLGTESYPTRKYEGFTLPAGKYTSLRVILGEGAGHNWWCVVFPPVCLDAAEEKISSALCPEDVKIVTEADGYVIKFRLVELWGSLVTAQREERIFTGRGHGGEAET